MSRRHLRRALSVPVPVGSLVETDDGSLLARALEDAGRAVAEWQRCRGEVERRQRELEDAMRAEGVARTMLATILRGIELPTALVVDPPDVSLAATPNGPAASGRRGEERRVDAASQPEVRWLVEDHQLSAYLFGAFRLVVGGRLLVDWNGNRAQLVLRYLLMHRTRAVPRDELIELLWPSCRPSAGKRNLHQAVYTLRRCLRAGGLDATWITCDHECYSLDGDIDLWCDVTRFDTAVRLSHELERNGDLEGAAQACLDAEALYVGDFMEDLPYEEWTMAERERLRSQYHDVTARLGHVLIELGQFDLAVTAAQRVLARDPLDESAHRRIMRAYGATGQPVLAARQYQLCAELLEREMQFKPSTETIDLYDNIVQRV